MTGLKTFRRTGKNESSKVVNHDQKRTTMAGKSSKNSNMNESKS